MHHSRRALCRRGLSVLASLCLLSTFGCLANEWNPDAPVDDYDPMWGEESGDERRDVSEASECDGVDNDGDGLVDEDCGCEPGTTQECYTGNSFDILEGTRCASGIQTCEGAPEFATWGPCIGAQLPLSEVCWDGVDNDCDGEADEGCSCVPGEERSCYDGPEGTEGVGACRAGTQTCIGEGMGWTPCDGQVLPTDEICYDDLDSNCNGEVDEECFAPIAEPVQCTTETMTHVAGAGDCGEDEAVFMMDDGDGPNFICCPLPAPDILTDEPPQVRGTTCAADEIITGAAGAYSMKCTRINTERYRLAAPQRPCYFGSGAAGGSGVSGCVDHPHTFSVLHQNYFGSDGCSGLPYGSLFVSQTGDDCRDLAAAQLLYTGVIEGDGADSPVPMFAE